MNSPWFPLDEVKDLDVGKYCVRFIDHFNDEKPVWHVVIVRPKHTSVGPYFLFDCNFLKPIEYMELKVED